MVESQKELVVKFQIFEQQIQAINQQMQAIEKALIDMQSISFGLDEVKTSVGKEMLAPIGNGIFTKAKLVSDELIIDIGGKNFVKRTVEETKNLISGQMEKLEDAKEKLNFELEEINKELTKTMMEYEIGDGEIGKKERCSDCEKDECDCEDEKD